MKEACDDELERSKSRRGIQSPEDPDRFLLPSLRSRSSLLGGQASSSTMVIAVGIFDTLFRDTLFLYREQ